MAPYRIDEEFETLRLPVAEHGLPGGIADTKSDLPLHRSGPEPPRRTLGQISIFLLELKYLARGQRAVFPPPAPNRLLDVVGIVAQR